MKNVDGRYLEVLVYVDDIKVVRTRMKLSRSLFVSWNHISNSEILEIQNISLALRLLVLQKAFQFVKGNIFLSCSMIHVSSGVNHHLSLLTPQFDFQQKQSYQKMGLRSFMRWELCYLSLKSIEE